MKARKRAKAFTLVELLVVIAIIAVLVSILLPVIIRARRKAIVLASPIACQSVFDNSLHVTDPTLTFDLRVTPHYGTFHIYRPGNLMWAPGGQNIGYELSNWQPGPQTNVQYMVIFNPLTGEMLKHPQMPAPSHGHSYFWGWVDHSKFIERAQSTLYVRTVFNGAVIRSTDIQHGIAEGRFYSMPSGASAPYIVVHRGGIRLAARNFKWGKAIWLPKDENSYPHAGPYRVDVDLMGDWVGWTMCMSDSPNHDHKVAIKRLSDPLAVEPTLITYPGFFTSWTDSGHLLLTTGDGLAILDKSGNLLRKTNIEGRTTGDEATWRRWHR